MEAAEGCDVVVLGWGEGNGSGAGAATRKAGVKKRAQEVWPLVRDSRPQCFKTNASGSPGHPLYLRNESAVSGYVAMPEYLAG